MKNTFFTAIFLMACFFMQAQDRPEPEIEINRDFNKKMTAVFGNLERDRVPYGLLYDYALAFADLEAYNGVVSDTTFVDVSVLSDIYKTLQMARIHPSTEKDFIPMKQYADTWMQYRKKYTADETDITLVLSGLYYKYAVIPESSFTNRKIEMDKESVKDVYNNGIWQNPYEERETVAITPAVSAFNSLRFNVLLPEELFLSNDKKNIAKISVNFGADKEYIPLAFGKKIPVRYTATGKYEWTFRIDKIDGSYLQIKVPILIEDPLTTLPVKGTPQPGQNNVYSENFRHSAMLRIAYAPEHNNLIKRPLIVAEGFDPESLLSPEKVGGTTTLDHFMKSIPLNSELAQLIRNDGTRQYDIIYVDWLNGVGDITKNAQTLIQIIGWVNNQKKINGSTATNVLIGQSMGGLIGRYALASMEKSGKEHEVSLFVAHDTPFQGANTPVSTQFLMRHIYGTYISNGFAVAIGEVIIPFIDGLLNMMNDDWGGDYTSPGTALGIQDTPAALQMSKYHVKTNSTVTSAAFENSRATFENMGYPKKSRNIAISNGNMCGTDHGFNGGDQLFFADREVKTNDLLKEILLNIGSTVWGFTGGNWKLGVIGSFIGKSKYNYMIDLRSIPEQNNSNRTVYRGSVRYHKKLWKIGDWGPTVSTDMVALREKSISGAYYPLETIAGGYNNLKSAVNGIVDFPNQAFINERYGFVPVASALNIKRKDDNLKLSDFRRPYNSTVLGDENLSTEFDSFITETTRGSRNNFGHITFSAKNSAWLANELNENRNSTTQFPDGNCSLFCGDIGITGANAICQNINTTFSIPQVPAGTNITWSVSGFTIVSGQGTKNLTVRATSNGNKTISATLISGVCGTRTLTKTVRVGAPQAPSEIYGVLKIPVFNGLDVSLPLTYEIDPVADATYYEWVLPGDYETVTTLAAYPARWQLLASTANSAAITAKSNMSTRGTIKVRACNDCSCSEYVSVDVTYQRQGGLQPQIGFEPNPANNFISVYALDMKNPPKFNNNRTSAVIYDLNQKARKRFEIIDYKATVDVSDLESGYYVIDVDLQNGNYESINLMIRR